MHILALLSRPRYQHQTLVWIDIPCLDGNVLVDLFLELLLRGIAVAIASTARMNALVAFWLLLVAFDVADSGFYS
jgi:hypothetical protein